MQLQYSAQRYIVKGFCMSWTYFAYGQSFVGLAALRAHEAQCTACQKRLEAQRAALRDSKPLYQSDDGEFFCVIPPDRAEELRRMMGE